MRIAIVHNQVLPDASQADRDVLVQASAVSDSLRLLGHEPVRLAATLDLKALQLRLRDLRPDIVFNLVESLDGSDWLMFMVPGLLDSMRIPYTGSPTESILLSTQKTMAKDRLRGAGLPTPGWLAGHGPRLRCGGSIESPFRPGARYVLKALAEHASVGLEEDCVVSAGEEVALRRRLREHAERLGCACFAEEYVDGREFNLSLLASPDGPVVLPPAEIDFSGFPQGKTRIVGYRAKWDEGSFEYRHTPRKFDFPPRDRPLLDGLGTLARRCWDLFGLGGYGRVDFRVDDHGRPWILEVNANPCLSPDAGFAAALQQASIPFDGAIQRILDDAAPSGGCATPDRNQVSRLADRTPTPAS